MLTKLKELGKKFVKNVDKSSTVKLVFLTYTVTGVVKEVKNKLFK